MPESRSQVRLAGAVVSGKSDAMPHSVAQEILDKMRGRKMSSLPERTNHPHARRLLARRKRS